jgi:Sec-independent protein translocase protein TatA
LGASIREFRKGLNPDEGKKEEVKKEDSTKKEKSEDSTKE